MLYAPSGNRGYRVNRALSVHELQQKSSLPPPPRENSFASSGDADVVASLGRAAKFLGVDADAPSSALTTLAMDAPGGKPGETIKKDLLPSGAVVNRDSASKAVYSKMFDWLVAAINAKCSDEASESQRANYIGILDIFGFEIFEHNGFEQALWLTLPPLSVTFLRYSS